MFSEDFYGDVSTRTSPPGHPENVADAIHDFWEADRERFKEMVADLLVGDVLSAIDDFLPEDIVLVVMDKIRETDTVTDLSAPVEVWIDDGGYYTVSVHDPAEEDDKFGEHASRRIAFVVKNLEK